MAQKVSKGRPESPLGSDTILLLNHILICGKEISPLWRRPKGFPVIVAPLSTSAFGGLATGEASPFGNLRPLRMNELDNAADVTGFHP